ncbi:MAG: Gfo/Idh/MocA family oxidoreductase [Phycisphaerae bacterium]|nr:Gfo/Idh/MocA family oxidoreductase [Phycisphaerae bacterium]
MLRVGIVGFGFMGRMHYAQWKALQGAEVTAVCDANPNIVQDTKKAVGNIAGAASGVDFEALELFSDYNKFLAEAKLDAVSISLPTFLHPNFSIQALEAGLHVLCEKPMALTLDECRKMMDAAAQSDKVLMIGHCVRFWPEYAETRKMIADGRYGRVIAATFQRLGTAPAWGDWFKDDLRSGGVAMDLHIHDTDFVQYLFGMPRAVFSRQAKAPAGGAIHIATQYMYDDDKVVVAEGGWGMTPAFGFEMSFNIVLEKATISYDCTRTPAFRVCPVDGETFTPQVASGDGYSIEIDHFARTVAGENPPQVITLEESRNSVKIVLAEKESAEEHRSVEL